MEYIVFMHRNEETPPCKEDWDYFFAMAERSGLFQGGSAIGKRFVVGREGAPDAAIHICRFMRFESENLSELNKLLEQHPVVKNGGSVEVFDLPKTP